MRCHFKFIWLIELTTSRKWVASGEPPKVDESGASRFVSHDQIQCPRQERFEKTLWNSTVLGHDRQQERRSTHGGIQAARQKRTTRLCAHPGSNELRRQAMGTMGHRGRRGNSTPTNLTLLSYSSSHHNHSGPPTPQSRLRQRPEHGKPSNSTPASKNTQTLKRRIR